MRILCFILFGIFLLQFADGGLTDGEETLHSYANELLKPLMSKTDDLNNTIQDYWTRYDKNMNKIDSRLRSLDGLGSNVQDVKNDTCKELEDTMAKAQTTVNNATVVLVKVLQRMAYIIDLEPSCTSINPFSVISCIAHKAQNVRNVYSEYKEQIVEKEIAAAKAINEILVEFINCLRRL